MHNYPLRVVEAMIASGRSLEAIEDFIENGTHLSEEIRSALWLFAWTETARENRPHRVSDAIEGEHQLAGRRRWSSVVGPGRRMTSHGGERFPFAHIPATIEPQHLDAPLRKR
jgi:hypothetical protein